MWSAANYQSIPQQNRHTAGGNLIQPKLKVGAPDDKYEQEADRIADKVMRMPDNQIRKQPMDEEEEMVQMQSADEEEELQMQPMEEEELQMRSMDEEEEQQEMQQEAPVIRKKCKECEGEEELQMKCKECEEKEKLRTKPAIRRQKDETAYVSPEITHQINASKGLGTPLPSDVQQEMSQKIGMDFSNVQIHTDTNAINMNQELNAKAFTYGTDLYFNRGEFKPDSFQGKHLLAHELTHTIQQKGAKDTRSIQRTTGDGHDLPAGSRFSGNLVLESVFDNEKKITAVNNRSGAHVRLVQEALIALNYPLPDFGADGMFGNETRRAVEAFQTDVGLGVDGVVGFRTIDFLDRRDRNEEVAPPTRPVTANAPFNVANAIVQPGAAPSNPLGACAYGLTFPENVQVRIDVFDNGGVWRPVLSEVVGNYSLQFRILPTQTEVTGPGGNTTAANYCQQITELNNLGHCTGVTPLPANWYMISAVLAHERVHASRFRDALIHPSVITPLETAIEGITIPRSILANNTAIAEFLIRANPAFTAALTTAQANWLARILVLVTGDHVAGGPTDTAEHQIVDPMVRRICAHARANGWPACPPLCP
jgi:peptidoglycan hydrolase-like protein with peptidoglycan-binding domain